MRLEGEAVAENQVGLKRFEGFVHERAQDAAERVAHGEHAIAAGAHEARIADVQRHLGAAAALQFGGAAGVVAVAVRQDDQGQVFGLDLVGLEAGQDALQVAGAPVSTSTGRSHRNR